jgi:hypothetical protein
LLSSMEKGRCLEIHPLFDNLPPSTLTPRTRKNLRFSSTSTLMTSRVWTYPANSIVPVCTKFVERWKTRLLGPEEARRLSGVRVSLLEAASIIANSGLTRDDYVIVWHRNTIDLKALRFVLTFAGYSASEILPPDDHIIRLNFLFRHSLDPPIGTHLSLEFLFNFFSPVIP